MQSNSKDNSSPQPTTPNSNSQEGSQEAANLLQAQELERSKRQREAALIQELEQFKKENETLKTLTTRIEKNGWDISTLASKPNSPEPVNPQILQMQEKQAQLEEKFAQRERLLERKEQLGEIRNYLDKNPDRYELIHLHGFAHKVQEVMDYHYEKERRILTPIEAADALEAELETYRKKDAQSVLQSKKVKDFYKEALTPTSNNKGTSTPPPAQTQTKTQDTSETPSKKPEPIIPATPKMPKLNFKEVLPSGAQASTSSVHKATNSYKSKEAHIADLVRKFQMG